MTMVLYRRTDEVVPWDPEDLGAFLRQRGVAIGPGGIGCGRDATGAFVRLDRPDGTVPATDLDTYVPPPDPVRTARDYLSRRARTIKAIAPANRTTADHDLLALLILLRQGD